MDEMFNRISIAYMDSIPLEKRKQFIESNIQVVEILKIFPGESNHYEEAVNTMNWLEKGNGKIIWYGEKDYPVFEPMERRLPYFLLYKGVFPKKEEFMISIVGTRSTDNDGFQAAFKLGLEAGANKISVVSGLADGCDHAALNGSDTVNYPSYAVLGCGLDYDYPRYARELKKRIIEKGGALISRFSPDSLPLKYNFPNRNLIIAALGQFTVVVQAPVKSGALITADLTLQMGKDVYISKAGEGQSWNRQGTEILKEEGAVAVEHLSDIIDCSIIAEESKDKSGYRFGNKHYFLKKLV